MEIDLYPILFTPVYKDYIWGGDRLSRIFGRESNLDVIAESWEVSDRPEGMSVVSNGTMSGRSLHDLVNVAPGLIVGRKHLDVTAFPLLIKIIDAKKQLSVQVHPNDETAAEHGGEAKTEMWYALEGEPDSRVFVGFKREVTQDVLERAVENKTLEDVLHSLPINPGDAVFIPGGRVHAIAEGCLLLEVQQNSNTTYRVYDWGRMGNDGKPRELHVEQAFTVMDWKDVEPGLTKPVKRDETESTTFWDVVESPYFNVSRIDLVAPQHVDNDGNSFHILFTVSGDMEVSGNGVSEVLRPGTSCLLPAGLSSYTVRPMGEKAVYIRVTL